MLLSYIRNHGACTFILFLHYTPYHIYRMCPCIRILIFVKSYLFTNLKIRWKVQAKNESKTMWFHTYLKSVNLIRVIWQTKYAGVTIQHMILETKHVAYCGDFFSLMWNVKYVTNYESTEGLLRIILKNTCIVVFIVIMLMIYSIRT
jgi:hypothetical protein